MCGISGYILKNNIKDGGRIINSMIKSLHHRGPDDYGTQLFNSKIKSEVSNNEEHNLAIANARLSILDLSKRGHQPMFNRDKSICIVHNGEIFNYLELREVLESKGYEFNSDTDTEVILYAYEEYGVDCLRHFNGMWAFLIYDMNKNILFCSRDRFGIKPFYYYKNEDFFVFASEIKALFNFPIKKITVNESLIMTNIVQGYRFVDGRRETYYNEIKQLKPSEYLVIDLNKESDNFEFGTFWKIDFDNQTRTHLSEKEAINKFRELLIDSVKIRLRSDVPYAFALSGGMDSSSIISIAKKILKKETTTFSIVYDKECSYDETEFIKPTIEDLKINSNFVFPEKGEFFKNLKRMIKYNDEPVPTVTFYSQWQLNQKIKEEGFTVILNGFAADELVAGYYDHYLYYFYELFKEGKKELLKKEIRLWQKNHSKSIDQWEKFKKKPTRRALAPINKKYLNLFKDEYKNKFNEVFEKKYTNNLLNNRMFNELMFESVPAVLRPDDRNSMMFSLESRSPFLDHRLVEFCYTLPNDLKIRDGLGKYILREAMKGILNDKVRNRKEKVGFNAPLNEWMTDELKKDIEKFLENDLESYRYIKKNKVLQLWNQHIENKENHMMLFWNFLNLEYWLRYFKEKIKEISNLEM